MTKYIEKPTYESTELIGKTIRSAEYAGKIRRGELTRKLITEAVGFDGKQTPLKGDGTGIYTVKPATIAIAIELGRVNDTDPAVRSLDLDIVGWVAESNAAADAIEVFFFRDKGLNAETIKTFFGLEDCNGRFIPGTGAIDALLQQNPKILGFWKIVEKATGKRVFLRELAECNDDGYVLD